MSAGCRSTYWPAGGRVGWQNHTARSEIPLCPLPAGLTSGDVGPSDIACRRTFALCSIPQATEDGREGKAVHGAAKEEDGERCSEADEEGAEDRRQAFVTFSEMLGFWAKGMGGGKDTESIVTLSLKSTYQTGLLHYLSVSNLSYFPRFPPAVILVHFPAAAAWNASLSKPDNALVLPIHVPRSLCSARELCLWDLVHLRLKVRCGIRGYHLDLDLSVSRVT